MENKKAFSETFNGEAALGRLLCEDVRVSTSQDYIIPESVFDTEEVLLTDRKVNLTSVSVEKGYVIIDGVITYDVLLLCEDGTLAGVSYSDDFSTSYTDSSISDSSTAFVCGCKSDGSSKLINPRKLNLSSDIVIQLTVVITDTARSVVDGAESLDDEMSLQRLCNEVERIKGIKIEDADIPVSLDLELDGNNPPISKILYRHLDLTTSEVKSRGDTLEVRSQGQLCIIYLSEEGNRFTLNKNLFLERSISVTGAENYTWSISEEYKDLTVEPAQNSYGEMKLLELDMTYSITACGIRNDTSRVFSDFYSTQYSTECSFTSSAVTKLKRSYSSSVSVNASASYEDVGASDARAVIASSACIRDVVVSFNKEKKKLSFEANALVKTVCENVYLNDTDKKYSSYTYTYPVKCELEASDETEGSFYSCDTSVYGVRCRVDGSKLFCDLELIIRINAYENAEVEHVSLVRIDRSAPVLRSVSAITLCYPSGSESLWDIAKYYKITEGDIISANALESNDISQKKVLLIPSYKSKKAAFSKVI